MADVDPAALVPHSFGREVTHGDLMDRLDQAPRSCFTFRRGSPRADEVVKRGKDDYLADELLQDAGDSLMMKLGEAPNRLVTARCFGSRRGRVGALAIANRNFIIHSWDELNRDQTWLTLSVDLPAWRESLFETFDDAERAVDAADAGSSWAEESPIPTSGRKSRQTIARSGELL